MPSRHDGPASPLFEVLPVRGNTTFKAIGKSPELSEQMRAAAASAPSGACTAWGIPFEIRRPLVLRHTPVIVEIDRVKARWLVFCHTTDLRPRDTNADGFVRPHTGDGRLAEHVADYVLLYADGREVRYPIRRRHQVGMLQRAWGENCFEAVAMRKPRPIPASHEQTTPWSRAWGFTQTRAMNPDTAQWCNFLWAVENPHPRRALVAVRVEPAQEAEAALVLSAISAGRVTSNPLRWETRRKALLTLPRGQTMSRELDATGLLEDVQLDLGQVISAEPRFLYPNERWARTYERQLAQRANGELIIEYTAHPDARFHLRNEKTLPVARLEKGRGGNGLRPATAATKRVTIRTVERAGKKAVPVKLHVHGESGEYLAPVDRHRIPNPSWFEDYSADYVGFDPLGRGYHYATYISGETTIELPLGKVYIEVSKGFEVKPVRKVFTVTGRTKTITIPLDKVLPWRERGWVTADTHVHFLSPQTAQLEGAAEGVNVVNLLASQWGELMTNVGDFDGKTTFGSREAGGDGEWLVRVGTENRQHVLGHISLCGYSGEIIAPMCAGGPDEAALGDPVDVLLTDWARKCRAQDGLVVFPHFPQPRAENAATLVHGDVDAVEMCSIGNTFSGIDPYSLSDWYRYLNCGYFYPAVGGTDKMAATTAVGTIRTYARIREDREFTYDAWKDAVRAGNTFVTYGPLLEFQVEGRSPGERLDLGRSGGTVSVAYELASVNLPMTRVELVVNGEIRESARVRATSGRGEWSVRLDRSSWLGLLVRGKYPDRDEVIAAHSSPVMAHLDGSRFFQAADAVTILEQIEGALAFLDTVGARADERAHKRMRLVLTSAHRKLHNEMHQRGKDHTHTPVQDHEDHHR